MKKALLAAAAITLSGCSYTLQLMPRDSGQMYQGTASGAPGGGSGPMSVTIDGIQYNGSWTAIRPGDQLTIMNAYARSGAASANAFGTSQSYGQSAYGRALLSGAGRGLRCEFAYSNAGAGQGVCVDDAKRVFDLQIIRN